MIKNVYVVGEMGTGKSALLNYLFGTKSKKDEIFRQGAGAYAVTKRVKSEIYDYNNVKIRFHDTPGLNEIGNAKEFENLMGIYKY